MLDIAARVLSAIALVALGVAGWLLQFRAQQAHESADNFEQQERRYLPMLRTLLELESTIQKTSDSLRGVEPSEHPIITEPAKRLIEIAHKQTAADMRAAAYSLYVSGPDPIISMHSPALMEMILSTDTSLSQKLLRRSSFAFH